MEELKQEKIKVAEPEVVEPSIEEVQEKIKEILRPGGIISSFKENYEYRPQQWKMAFGIVDSFRNKKHFLCEAPTGSGKSFAYLIPSMLMSLKSEYFPIVVSTGTIALQEQIMKKDVPFLKKIIPGVKVALAKGKSNYLCVQRKDRYFAKYFGSEKLAPDDNLIRLKKWVDSTKEGDKTEIDFKYEPKVWGKICANSDDCLGKKCKELCYLKMAKAKLKAANIVVANHYLMFSDLEMKIKLGFNVLPEHKYLVIDEAHKAEDVATEYFSTEFSSGMMKDLLDDCYNPKNDDRRGVMYAVFLNVNILETDKFEKEIIPVYEGLKHSSANFFKTLDAVLGKESIKRIKNVKAFVDKKEFKKFKDELFKFSAMLKKVGDYAADHVKHYSEDTIKDLKSVINRGAKFIDCVKAFEAYDPECVYYVEKSKNEKNPNVSLKVKPINVSEILKEHLFDKMHSVILTSATLSSNNDFKYIQSRIGVGNNCYGALLPPVFDYKKQVKMYIARDLPNPKSDEFNDAAVTRIGEMLKHFGGKSFVLFTNYYLMKKAYEALEESLKKEGIEILIQGDGISSLKLIEKFKKDVNSVLFGTDTFWEGVDVPGETLSNVIIVKLPFDVPNHPVIEARMEYIDNHGGKSFFDYTVPKAAIKFKQGFGRLIRNKADFGMFCVLDSRVSLMSYGRIFINSLPECERVGNYL